MIGKGKKAEDRAGEFPGANSSGCWNMVMTSSVRNRPRRVEPMPAMSLHCVPY